MEEVKEKEEKLKEIKETLGQLADAIIEDLGKESMKALKKLHKTHYRLIKLALIGSYIAGSTVFLGALCWAGEVGSKTGNLIMIVCGLICACTCWYGALKRTKELHELHEEDRKDWLEAMKK